MNNLEQQVLVKALEDIRDTLPTYDEAITNDYRYALNRTWHIATEALQSLSGKENKIPDDFYPGYEYQNLFNWLSDKNFSALQSEMQELIEIVHRDFSKEQSGDQLSAGNESELYKSAYNLMLFIGDDGEPFDGFRFREQAIELQKAIDDYKSQSQPEDTHIMLNRLQEYGNRGREIERLQKENNLLEERDYWKQRCEAAESFIEFSPGDPDITGLQINAHKKWLALKQHRS